MGRDSFLLSNWSVEEVAMSVKKVRLFSLFIYFVLKKLFSSKIIFIWSDQSVNLQKIRVTLWFKTQIKLRVKGSYAELS